MNWRNRELLDYWQQNSRSQYRARIVKDLRAKEVFIKKAIEARRAREAALGGKWVWVENEKPIENKKPNPPPLPMGEKEGIKAKPEKPEENVELRCYTAADVERRVGACRRSEANRRAKRSDPQAGSSGHSAVEGKGEFERVCGSGDTLYFPWWGDRGFVGRVSLRVVRSRGAVCSWGLGSCFLQRYLPRRY